MEERVAAGKIHVERWSITHVAPAPVAKKGDPQRYSISSDEFMTAAIRCSDASPNISKRVKLYQGDDEQPDCLTVRPKLLPIVPIKESKAGERRKIITAEAFIERGEIVIPIDNLEQTPIRTLVERINDAAAKIRLGNVRHAGQLQYVPPPLIKVLPEYPDIRLLCGEDELKDASRGDGSAIHLVPQVLRDIIEQKAEALGLTERQKASLMSLADAALAPEEQTEFGGAKFRNLNFALIQERLEDSDAPAAFYIRSDCADLKRLNYIFSGYNIKGKPVQNPKAGGRKMTYNLVSALARIFEQEMQKCEGNVTCFRGESRDEFGAFVSGTSEKLESQVKRTIAAIHKRTDSLLERMKISNIVRPKPSYRKSRSSMACGYASIPSHCSLESLISYIDTQTEWLRQRRIENRKYQLSSDEIEHAQRVLAEEMRSLDIDLDAPSPRMFPYADEIPESEEFIWPELERERQTEMEIRKLGLAQSEAAELFCTLLDLYENYDPITGCSLRPPEPMIASGLDYLRRYPGSQSMHTLVFEIQNLEGLNEGEGGRPEADKILHELASLIRIPDKSVMRYRIQEPGDQICVFASGLSDQTVAEYAKDICLNFKRTARDMGLGNLEHPRYRGDSRYDGVKLVAGGVRLDPSKQQTVGDVISQVKNQIRENKNKRLCFDATELGAPGIKVRFNAAQRQTTRPRKG